MKAKRKRTALIICNGAMPTRKITSALLEEKPLIVCADGGANKARTFGILPHCIIGDLDSITEKTRRTFRSVQTIYNPDQYSTDLEKALDFVLKKKIRKAVVIGATGKRADHTVANFSILRKYHDRMDISFVDAYCDIRIVTRSVKFEAPLRQIISLAPLGKCSGIITKGLKYPLKDEPLEIGVNEGHHNEVVSSPVKISVKKGSLLLFMVRKK
ncbi:MAG: thiamine diphosphokinase [Bacteroidota bacterium]|nr:thiamine diphosphokinase [Bacteroidota bacterium]